MNAASPLEITTADRVAKLGHSARSKISCSVHHSCSAYRKHGQAERFQAAKDPKFVSNAIQQFGNDFEIGGRMFHAHQIRKLLGDLRHSLCGD